MVNPEGERQHFGSAPGMGWLKMSGAKAVLRSGIPRTRATLAADLLALGVTAGMTVLVHSSLSSLGWVCGGSVTVVEALLDVVTPQGTIVMPTFTDSYSEPAYWQESAVPLAWWPTIRATNPAFNPQLTPSEGMGQIAETFRTWPGTLRSSHPASSFAALGRYAADITSHHPLDFSLGEESPLARLYCLDSWVLFLGTGYANNTSFHLAEYRAPGAHEIVQGAAIIERGQRVWKPYRDIELDLVGRFAEIGIDFEQANRVETGLVGSATARLFGQRAAVDFAVQWLTAYHTRTNPICPSNADAAQVRLRLVKQLGESSPESAP